MTVTPKQLAEDLQGLRWDLKLAIASAIRTWSASGRLLRRER